MSILLEPSEISACYEIPENRGYIAYDKDWEIAGKAVDIAIGIAQAKKILIELQTIYNLPDEGMFHKKLGDFIQSLLEEMG